MRCVTKKFSAMQRSVIGILRRSKPSADQTASAPTEMFFNQASVTAAGSVPVHSRISE